MPWYKSGTVSVTQNSNAVIGTGTAFIANGRVGDAFRGPDGGWYEVTNIASDTALSISPNYQGATNAAGIYALAPMQGYVKDSADALRALVNQFGGVLAVLGDTPTLPGVRASLNLSDTDGLLEGAANLYFSSTRAIASPLTGLATATNTPVVATDSLLIAAGKLQAQVSAALPKAGGTLTGPINDAPIQTMASAATVNIGAATSNVISISGTTTITGLGTIAVGTRRTLRFLGVLILTHNAASLILPAGANITSEVNDSAEFLSLGGGNWICLDFTRASGKPVAFAFDRSNIIGTVSQASGIPTGAIVESGSNSNGTYAKYADGTLICRSPPMSMAGPSVGFGALYISSVAAVWTFPAPSAGVSPAVSACTGNDPSFLVSSRSTSNSSASFVGMYPASAPAAWTIYAIAIGRWY